MTTSYKSDDNSTYFVSSQDLATRCDIHGFATGSDDDAVDVIESVSYHTDKHDTHCGSTYVSQMPLLVIQEMKPEFLLLKDEDKQYVNFQGGLHPRHSDYIARVHVVHPCRLQLYVVSDLNLHLHYSISPAHRLLFMSHCHVILQSKTDYVEYKSDRSYTEKAFLQIWNFGTPQFTDALSRFFDKIDLTNKIYHLFDNHKDPVTGRNNFQVNVGYTGVSLKKNNPSQEAKPQLLKNSAQFFPLFLLMSQLARHLDLELVNILSAKDNDELMKAFHKNIHDDNLFTGGTFAMYDGPDRYLHMHADIMNGRQDGHNVQMTASAVFLGDDNQPKRVLFAVYGRECCSQYIHRDWQSKDLEVRLRDMIQHMPKWRHAIDPAFPPEGGKRKSSSG